MEESKKRRGLVGNRFENLAPEIISDILSRLSIEWILSCKCVCKTWHALIKDSYFVKLHLRIANHRPSYHVILEPNINIYGITNATKIKSFLFDIQDRKAREIPRFPHVDTKMYGKHMRIMCTLNGLICLAPDFCYLDPVVVCNPLIRGDCIILPKTEAYDKIHLYGVHQITLGFDHLINKYKAVRVLSYHNGFGGHCLYEVITIGEETSWRPMAPPYAGVYFRISLGGVFHQGSIYWIIENCYNPNDFYGEPNENNRDYLLEFDVTKEVFRLVSFPHSMRRPTFLEDEAILKSRLQITEEGSLALMENDGQLLHIWRIVKGNGINPVVAYSSIRIDLARIYRGARVIALLRSDGIDEEFMLLERPPGKWVKDKGRKKRETQFLYYFPFSSSSKKSDRFLNLSTLQIHSHEKYIAWCFRPSLVSPKAALLGNNF